MNKLERQAYILSRKFYYDPGRHMNYVWDYLPNWSSCHRRITPTEFLMMYECDVLKFKDKDSESNTYDAVIAAKKVGLPTGYWPVTLREHIDPEKLRHVIVEYYTRNNVEASK